MDSTCRLQELPIDSCPVFLAGECSKPHCLGCDQGCLQPGRLVVTWKMSFKVIPISNPSCLGMAESPWAGMPVWEARPRKGARQTRTWEPANKWRGLSFCCGVSLRLSNLQKCFFEWFQTMALSLAALTTHGIALPGWKCYHIVSTSSFSFPKELKGTFD